MDCPICHLALAVAVIGVCLAVGGVLALASVASGALFALIYEHVLR